MLKLCWIMELSCHQFPNHSVGFLSIDECSRVPIGSILVGGPRYVCLANGQMVEVKRKFPALILKLYRLWGPVEIQAQVFVVFPGDDVLSPWRITFGMLGISPNAEPDWTARGKSQRSASACR